jgi:phosphoglycolate phosphatase
MSNPYALIVFDWEGTLGDPLGHILQVLSEEASRLGFGDIEKESARRLVVFGLDKAIRRLFPNLVLHQHERLLMAVQKALSSHHQDHHLFPGALKLVQDIHAEGMHLAIATNKNAQALQHALQATGLDSYFGWTRAAGQAEAKPSPEMLQQIMVHFVVDSDKTLMIGDSVSDIEMARALGVRSIGVDFYHQQADDLIESGASFVVNQYDKIGKYLELPNY